MYNLYSRVSGRLFTISVEVNNLSVYNLYSRVSGRPFTISVEGNVGSGKSTLLQYFNDYPDISVYKEVGASQTNSKRDCPRNFT